MLLKTYLSLEDLKANLFKNWYVGLSEMMSDVKEPNIRFQVL